MHSHFKTNPEIMDSYSAVENVDRGRIKYIMPTYHYQKQNRLSKLIRPLVFQNTSYHSLFLLYFLHFSNTSYSQTLSHGPESIVVTASHSK
jgi:phosphoribosylpyrophosphate synthetase